MDTHERVSKIAAAYRRWRWRMERIESIAAVIDATTTVVAISSPSISTTTVRTRTTLREVTCG